MKRFAWIAALAWAAFAEDQVVEIRTVPRPIVAPKLDGKVLTPADPFSAGFAPDLITNALPRTAGGGQYQLDAKRYYLIHVATLSTRDATLRTESWSTYQKELQHPSFLQHATDPWTDWFKQKRVFGSPDAAIVYLYWVKASRDPCDIFNQVLDALRNSDDLRAQAEEDKAEADKAGAKAQKADAEPDAGPPNGCQVRSRPPTVTDEIDRLAIKVANNLVYRRQVHGEMNNKTRDFSLVDKESGTPVVAHATSTPEKPLLVSQLSRDLLESVTYKVAITKKIPTPLANLRDVLKMGLLAAQGGKRVVFVELKEHVCFAGGMEFQVKHLPSDMVVSPPSSNTASGDAQQVSTSSTTWDNERRYPIDFSLALPFISYKEGSVDLTNGIITAREVTKQRLVAMLDFSPWWLFDRGAGFETKNIRAQLLPVVMVGLPIAGKPLQHPIVALGIGINKAHIFAGTQFNLKPVTPASASVDGADSSTVTSPAGPITRRWGTQFVWGINFSVKTVTELLKGKP